MSVIERADRGDNHSEKNAYEIDAASIESQDFRQRQEFKGRTLFLLAFQAVGIVFGDIGTSPLYVYSSTFTANPERDELICAVSLIIWSLTIIVTVKYVLITLYADDAGEGGTFALYSLLARYASIEDKEPGKATKELNRYKTNEISSPIRGLRTLFERNRLLKLIIRFAGIFGVCCLLADGVFTPAQSVLGAIQGVRVQNPSLSIGAIIGISIGILVLLFASQPLGINRLSFAFAPIVTLWLLFNVASAIYNFAKFDAGVFIAFNPYYAGKWFVVRGSDAGFRRLGGILLCFTGVEALFADIGALSRKAVQLSWLCFAWPCLVITYLGQAANISRNPSNYANPFFLTLPPGCFWPGLILSVLAAIVASQAIITGSFQILSQAMALCYFPRMKITFTSAVVHNQCYVSLANWLLMIGCVIVTGVFNNTTSLGNAYGLCVILVTMVTTCMVSLVAMFVWRFNPFLVVLPLFLIFVTFDGLWLSISLFKVPNGAWVTIMIALVLSSVMVIWRTGKSWQWRAEAEQIALVRGDIDVTKEYSNIEGVGVFFDETDERVPPIFSYWLRSFEARHQITIFAHLRQTFHPTVKDEDRFQVTALPDMPRTFRVLARYGYAEPRSAIAAASAVISAVGAFLDVQRSNTLPETAAYGVREDAEILAAASAKKAPVYLFGRKDIQVKAGTKNPMKLAVVWTFILLRDLLTAKPKLWDLPADQIVEIGKALPIG